MAYPEGYLKWLESLESRFNITAGDIWEAAQAAERERIMKALDDTLTLRWGIPSEALLLARSAISKCEGEK